MNIKIINFYLHCCQALADGLRANIIGALAQLLGMESEWMNTKLIVANEFVVFNICKKQYDMLNVFEEVGYAIWFNHVLWLV